MRWCREFPDARPSRDDPGAGRIDNIEGRKREPEASHNRFQPYPVHYQGGSHPNNDQGDHKRGVHTVPQREVGVDIASRCGSDCA